MNVIVVVDARVMIENLENVRGIEDARDRLEEIQDMSRENRENVQDVLYPEKNGKFIFFIHFMCLSFVNLCFLLSYLFNFLFFFLIAVINMTKIAIIVSEKGAMKDHDHAVDAILYRDVHGIAVVEVNRLNIVVIAQKIVIFHVKGPVHRL